LGPALGGSTTGSPIQKLPHHYLMKDVLFDRDMKDILSKLHLGDLFIL
jgi:hypothetical protein